MKNIVRLLFASLVSIVTLTLFFPASNNSFIDIVSAQSRIGARYFDSALLTRDKKLYLSEPGVWNPANEPPGVLWQSQNPRKLISTFTINGLKDGKDVIAVVVKNTGIKNLVISQLAFLKIGDFSEACAGGVFVDKKNNLEYPVDGGTGFPGQTYCQTSEVIKLKGGEQRIFYISSDSPERIKGFRTIVRFDEDFISVRKLYDI